LADALNQGTLNLQPDANSFCVLNVSGQRNYTISGNGNVNHYYIINQSLVNNSSSLTINSFTFSAVNDFLYLNSGIFNYRVSGNTTITPYNVTYSIFPNSGIVMDAPNSVMNFTNALVLNGLLQIKQGTVNIGDATDEYCAIAGGTLSVSGGSVNLASILSTNSINDFANINIQGGTLTVNRVASTFKVPWLVIEVPKKFKV